MEINAYYDGYLTEAQETLGNMMEYAINICNIAPESFYTMFLNSGIAGEFEKGNPRVVAGMTGGELAKEVIFKITGKERTEEEVYDLDKTPEFWTGWILAYYQWKIGRSFRKINEYLSINDILCMYPTHHEADVSKFVDTAEKIFRRKHTKTYLCSRREMMNYSKSRLADESSVSIEIIDKLENDFTTIWNTDVSSLYRLAKVLKCDIDELLEI